LGVLYIKIQIPSTPPKSWRAGKLQINPPAIARHERAGLKFQYPMTETLKYEALFDFSNFGHWDLIFDGIVKSRYCRSVTIWGRFHWFR